MKLQAIPRQMFQEILRLIAELRPKPPPAPHDAIDGHAFKSARREERVRMQRKTAQVTYGHPTARSQNRPFGSLRKLL
jgi:hypothetical protein